jgi:hypothetical protein
VFVSVFADEESIYLLRAIDDVLQEAGWKRGKPVGGFPGINIYGNEPKNFPVATGVNIGVQVTVQTPQEIAGDAPIQTLPPYIQAAGTLNISLSRTLSPPQENQKLVNQEKGDSQVVRIAVGRKP